MDAIFNAHPQWKLPARRLHQSFDHWNPGSWKGDAKANAKVWSNGELHVELGGSYRTGQQTALAALRTLPFILPDELNVARLFGNDGGLTMLSFDPKAKKAGRFSDGDNGSDYDSGYDYGSDSDSSCGLWSCS